MGKYKQFKTWVRKKIGMIGVGEFVDDAVKANTLSNWNSWFSNEKYLKGYATPERIASYVETIILCENEGVPFSEGGKAIDVGCGTGHLLRELKKRHPAVAITGTDFSEESLAVSKQVNEGGEFSIMDVYDIPSDRNGMYDFVICSEVLEHLLDPENALKGILGLAAKEAYIILTVPNGRIDTYGGHINFWSPESWQVFVNKNVDGTKYSCSFHVFNNNRNNFVLISRKQNSDE